MKKTAKPFSGLIANRLIMSSEVVPVIGPDSQKPIGQFCAMNTRHVNRAFQSARSAFPVWSQRPLPERIKLLNRWTDQLRSRRSEIIRLMVQEIAKSPVDATAEFDRTLELIADTIAESKILFPIVRTDAGVTTHHKIGLFFRVPRGVTLAIAPFNYPFNLAITKIVPALVTGNTVVFKPATNGSLLGCVLGECFKMARFPAGVINVVVGRGSKIGHALTSNSEIDVIGFTGSVKTGQQLLTTNPTAHIFLELGGKDVLVVLADADLNQVARAIIQGGLSYSGQRCTAIKLVACDEQVADQLLAILTPMITKLRVGSAQDGNDIVPLINQQSADYVTELIDDALEHGAKLIMGHRQQANLVWPTILDQVTLNMRIAHEEQFGPVIPIIRFSTWTEVPEIVNYSPFGLQAAIFTTRFDQAWQLAQKLEVGTVNWNGKTQRGPDYFPFLGVKASGYGEPQSVRDSLLGFTRSKGFVINHNNAAT